MLKEWPTPAFIEELKAKAYTSALQTLSAPNEELGITVESLRGYQITDLTIQFSHLSIVLEDHGRRTHYFRVKYDIGPLSLKSPMLPLFWYEVEFSPEGEIWDDFFDHF